MATKYGGRGRWCSTWGDVGHSRLYCFLLDHFLFDHFLSGIVDRSNMSIRKSPVRGWRSYLMMRRVVSWIRQRKCLIIMGDGYNHCAWGVYTEVLLWVYVFYSFLLTREIKQCHNFFINVQMEVAATAFYLCIAWRDKLHLLWQVTVSCGNRSQSSLFVLDTRAVCQLRTE